VRNCNQTYSQNERIQNSYDGVSVDGGDITLLWSGNGLGPHLCRSHDLNNVPRYYRTALTGAL